MEEEEISARVAEAAADPAVLAALTRMFRNNCRDASGARRDLGPGQAEAMAEAVLRHMGDPDVFPQVEVGGVRFDLEAGTPETPTALALWGSVWDDDEEVWRRVGRVVLPR